MEEFISETNDPRALNKLYKLIGSESFSANVSINEIDTGTQYGRINITDHLSPGKLEILSLDSNKYHTLFDMSFQSFSFEDGEMRITGYSTKEPMEGFYEVVLTNFEKRDL